MLVTAGPVTLTP